MWMGIKYSKIIIPCLGKNKLGHTFSNNDLGCYYHLFTV